MRSLSASSMDDSWQLTPLTISSSSSSKQRSCSGLSNENEYSYLQLQSLSDNNNNNSKQPHQDQSCYISGSDGKEEPQKIFHRFFDEWPPKSRNSWLDLDDKSSTTQLSISIPTSSHDFTTFSSTNQRGNEFSSLHSFSIYSSLIFFTIMDFSLTYYIFVLQMVEVGFE